MNVMNWMTIVQMKQWREGNIFLVSDGSVDVSGRIFISGSVMNELVCHNKVKKNLCMMKLFFSKIHGVYQMIVINER